VYGLVNKKNVRGAAKRVTAYFKAMLRL
jgi:hypothetical protein